MKKASECISLDGSIKSKRSRKKRVPSIGSSFPPWSNLIARHFFRSADPAGVSNPMVQPARNRDRQCRCFTRCSTSMTIAGNFVRSVCVLSRLSPSPPPPPIPRNPFSFTSPFIPRAFLYLAVPGRSIQFSPVPNL